MKGICHPSNFKAIILPLLLTAVILIPAEGQARKNGDYYTSDLINAAIAVGPVAEARANAPDVLANRRVDMSVDDIQREFAEGISEIHRAASVIRIEGKGGPEMALESAREKGAEILIIPRIEQLTIDEAGRNGLDPVAKVVDVALFPVTLIEALVYRGERAGLGSQYLPLYDMMVTMHMTLDFYRVSDGTRILRQRYPRVSDIKVNKDNLEGARFESSDDWITVGREQGRFLVRETGREVAKERLPEILESAFPGQRITAQAEN